MKGYVMFSDYHDICIGMINIIKDTLGKLGISEYLIREAVTQSMEMFFVKRSLDVRRTKDAHIYEVVVYNEFEKNGKRCKGHSTTNIYPGMKTDEIEKVLKSAFLAASFVANPWYELPDHVDKAEAAEPDKAIAKLSLAEGSRIMTEALFAEDNAVDYNGTEPFLNSAELFISRKLYRIISWKGSDVSFIKWKVCGEFVAQCKNPQDVETYSDFEFDDLKTDALKAKVRRTLDYTKARTEATKAPKAGKYDVIISGPFVKSIFDYYLDRAGAGYVYAGYPHFTKGKNVWAADEEETEGLNTEASDGDTVTLTLKADVPFSEEAIPMKDRLLIDNGILKCYFGGARFSYYIGEEATGHYDDIEVAPGTMSFEDMKKTPYLHIVNFSDFQVDSTTGSFGGEIRLAFLYDGEKEIPVTGGSINGKIFEAQKTMKMSTELQEDSGYKGPFAIRLNDINVAGE